MSDTRDLFRSLRDADGGRAPSFAATLASGRARAAAPGRPGTFPAAAAVLAGLVLAFVLVPRVKQDGSLRAAIASAREMSAWSAPTAVFLDPIERTLQDSTPTLALSSVPLPE
ncbi:MAG TPA: hypothetical protein VMT33_02355 [Candidatus Bathyarchaeia archaeon]|nr:hypothetical protein [Candidatus Bathyarchaeia archaeon]